MKVFICVLLLAALVFAGKYDNVEKLQVGIKFRPEKCDKKVANGDSIKVHYTVCINVHIINMCVIGYLGKGWFRI